MAVIPGQLERAQLENLSADPSNLPEGRVWANTTSDRAKVVLNGSAQVLVTEAQSQTLTGKTIDGDDNTLQDIAIAALKTVLAQANRFISRDASGVVIDTKAVPTGDVVGTTDSQTLTNKIYQDANIVLDRVSMNQADVATAATIIALSTAEPLIRFTGSTATEVQGIDATGVNKVVTYHNASSVNVTFKHQNAGATATNRIITPTGNDLIIKPNQSVQWIYDNTQTRWVIGAGSGGGGDTTIFGTRASPRLITSSGITVALGHMSASDLKQVIFIKGSIAGENLVTANPRIQAGTVVGQEMVLIACNSDEFPRLNEGNGLDINGDWTGFNGSSLTLLWDGTNWTEISRR